MPQPPYTVGSHLVAWRHTPPPPLGRNYRTPSPTQHPHPAALSQDQLCFLRRPCEGSTDLSDIKHLIVTSLIRTGAGRGPQLVVVNGNMVAKIYDALHYNLEEYSDPVWWADRSYSREAAAYEHLQKSEDLADVIPTFYGTWTINIDTTVNQDGHTAIYERPVRIILLEYLDGQCMEAVDGYSLPEVSRTAVLRQCIDAEMCVLNAGVNHGDFCPRNIMTLGSDYHTPKVRVKLIDFDVSEVYDHPNFTHQDYVQRQREFANKWEPKLVSPIKRHFGQLMGFSCNGWCPGGEWGAEQWLWQNYAQDARYVSVRWDKINGPEFPLYVNDEGNIDDPDYDEDDTEWRSGSETYISGSEDGSKDSE